MAVLDFRDGADPLVVLTRQLIDAADRPDRDKPYGIYYISSESAFSSLGRFVEREVFREVFGNDDHAMDTEYGPFEPVSDFILAVDQRIEEPAGVMRLIRPNPRGLKTLIDVAADPRWGTDESDFIAHHEPESGMGGVHDIATLAVRGGWTGDSPDLRPSHALYAGLYRWCLANSIELLVGAIDVAVASLLVGLRFPMEPLCDLPAVEYLGSEETRPYVISVPEARRRMRVDTELRSLLFGDLVDREFSFPPIELDAEGIDLQAELRTTRQPRAVWSR